jgi:hypothetical protein
MLYQKNALKNVKNLLKTQFKTDLCKYNILILLL